MSSTNSPAPPWPPVRGPAAGHPEPRSPRVGSIPRMKFIEAADHTGSRPWAALDLAEIPDATVRLHWTDAPYKWHVNSGVEAFVVLDGAVDMHYKSGGDVLIERLTPGRICIAEEGDEHVAHPDGAARILVVEQRGSV